MKEWKITKHNIATDGTTEHITYELLLDFPVSTWNNSSKRPVVILEYSDYRVSKRWLVSEKKFLGIKYKKYYTHKPHKSCVIKFVYFQNCPKEELYTSRKRTYDRFTIKYCQDKAEELLWGKLQDVISQLK
jgi:hypothetical protein